MPVENMTYLIGSGIQIISDSFLCRPNYTFVSVVRAETTGDGSLFLFAATPSGGRWLLPARHRPRNTNKMFILDLCGRATLEVDYR